MRKFTVTVEEFEGGFVTVIRNRKGRAWRTKQVADLGSLGELHEAACGLEAYLNDGGKVAPERLVAL